MVLRFIELVGVSREVIDRLVEQQILPKGGTYRVWLINYCAKLRAEAAGRGGVGHETLTEQRTRESRLKGDVMELQIAEKSGQLVPVGEVEPRITAMIIAARTELLTMADKLRNDIQTQYGIDIPEDLINGHVHNALRHLAGRCEDDDVDDVESNDELGSSTQHINN